LILTPLYDKKFCGLTSPPFCSLFNHRGEKVSDDFLELPSREVYPDYFQMIRAPICLNQIKEKIGKGTYEGTFVFLETDITLMVDNAKTYNKKGSPIYQNAVRIMVCSFSKKRKKKQTAHISFLLF